MIDYEEFKKEMLSDPETKAEYDALTPEYDIIQAMIDAKKGSVFIIPKEETKHNVQHLTDPDEIRKLLSKRYVDATPD